MKGPGRGTRVWFARCWRLICPIAAGVAGGANDGQVVARRGVFFNDGSAFHESLRPQQGGEGGLQVFEVVGNPGQRNGIRVMQGRFALLVVASV